MTDQGCGDAESANLQIARRYLAAIERGDDGQEIGEFLHPDVVLEMMPNRLMPSGKRSDRQAMLVAAEVGRKLMQSQRYEITAALASGDRVALEVTWSGTLAAAFGDLPAGTALRARLGVFLELCDGRIIAQRNYDCYEQ